MSENNTAVLHVLHGLSDSKEHVQASPVVSAAFDAPSLNLSVLGESHNQSQNQSRSRVGGGYRDDLTPPSMAHLDESAGGGLGQSRASYADSAPRRGGGESGGGELVGRESEDDQGERVARRRIAAQTTERALLRDVLFAFQGIDGQHVKVSEGVSVQHDPAHTVHPACTLKHSPSPLLPRIPTAHQFSKELEAYVLDPSLALPPSTRDLVCQLCEMGWLFGRVAGYVNRGAASAGASVTVGRGAGVGMAGGRAKGGRERARGLLGQAFCSALQEELSDYYRLIAVLEAQLHAPHTGNG